MTTANVLFVKINKGCFAYMQKAGNRVFSIMARKMPSAGVCKRSL